MERWSGQHRGHRAEPTQHFASITTSRAMLVVGGVTEDEIMEQQSKDRSTAMHDHQIEVYQERMFRSCVQIMTIVLASRYRNIC